MKYEASQKRTNYCYTVACYAVVISLSCSHSVWAQTSADEEVQETEVVSVIGRRTSEAETAIGMDKASNTLAVTRAELLSAPAGISGLKMLENLPGFNVQTDGALGLYEFGNSVHARAFNLRQIGFVLDGIPMGRSDAFGGSPIFRYVDNENLGSVVASPGAGDVSAPSYASLGPIATYYSTDPAEKAGGVVAFTAGEDNLQRSFIKLETGNINGFAAYVSRSKTDSDLWRGPGTIDREHYEAKAVYDVTESVRLQATYVSNDFFDFDSPSSFASTFEDNYEFGYLEAIPDTCTSSESVDFNRDGVIDDNDFTPVFTDGSCTQYFADRVNIRDDELFSFSTEAQLTEQIAVNAIYYREEKDGFGVSPDSYSNSLGIYNRQVAAGLDVVHPRGVQYGLSTVGGDRDGGLVTFTLDIANHTIEVGGWVEEDTYNRTQLRLNNTDGSADGAVLFDEVVYFRRDYTAVRDTTQLFVKDSISLMDGQLNVEAGFKSLSIDYSLDGFRDFADYEINSEPGLGPQSVGAKYTDNFLPMIGVVYNLNGDTQIFSSYSENFALPEGTDDIFDNAVTFDAPAPEGEESKNVELGIRTSKRGLNGAVAVYFTEFDNRLFVSNILNPATGQPESFYINGGASESYGIEVSGVYQPELFGNVFYLNGNLAYNRSELVDGFGPNPAGSVLADSPEWLFTGGITYEPTDWLVANVSGKYTGTRFTDYAETFTMDNYWVFSAYVDIGGANDFGLPENLNIRLNVDNLFDEEVLSFAFTGSPFFRPLNPRTIQATATLSF
jgi:iron complex outermembrane receptor protein